MIKHFAIGIFVLLGSATVSFAGEVAQTNILQQAQKVNVDTHVNIPTSTGANLSGGISHTAKPKPPGPGGTNPSQTRPGINSNIDIRVRPKPKGPGGTETLPQINSINQAP